LRNGSNATAPSSIKEGAFRTGRDISRNQVFGAGVSDRSKIGPAYYIVCGLIFVLITPASATSFFLAFDTTSDQCRIMVTEPDGQVMRKIGSDQYASYRDAQTAMQAMPECNATQ
jgi:hypothetical protein